jgi:Txe/YoeB family toxin of Txe-Axe toxin-antitoxin module
MSAVFLSPDREIMVKPNAVTEVIRRKQRDQRKQTDRRTQSRTDSVLSKIENATYEILRKYEKKSA